MEGDLRSNSAEYMVNQLRALHDEYGMDQFNIGDSNFSIPKPRMIEFCELMKSSGLSKKISLWIQMSATIPMKSEELFSLKEAGVSMIGIGVERFDDETRRNIKKTGTRAQVMKIIEKISESGLKAHLSILINFPSDNKAVLEKEKKYLLQALDKTEYFGVHYLVPVPGTPIYDENNAVYGRWYLRDDVNRKKLSYYDRAFDITTPGIEFNLFSLSSDQVRAIREFKEEVYDASVKKLRRSVIFKLAYFFDTKLGRISFALYSYSPAAENFIFFSLKILREYMMKYFKAKLWIKKNG